MKRNIVSTTQLAKICGVSQGTVDRALNDRKGINPKTKEKILAVAKEYGYRPNIHARSISGGKSMLIGIVVFDLYNEYFSNVLTSIEEKCRSKGYSTVVMFTHKDGKSELECIDNLYRMYVDAIVLCPINKGEEFENYLQSLEIPIVTIGNRLNNFAYVGIDNYSAMEKTVEYVIGHNYEQIVYVTPKLKENQNIYAQTERVTAFLDTCKLHNIEHTAVSIADVEDIKLRGCKTAIICSSDIYALQLTQFAKRQNYGIIGFDNIRIIDKLGVALDSVSYNVERVGEAVTDLILKGEAKDVIVSFNIVRRGSI